MNRNEVYETEKTRARTPLARARGSVEPPGGGTRELSQVDGGRLLVYVCTIRIRSDSKSTR